MDKHLNIQLNKELNRWELHFVKTPNEDLSNYLERLGYRYNPKKPRLYFAPNHKAYQLFADKLKASFAANQDYRAIQIEPSHIPHPSNITHNKFSYVTLSYQRSNSIGKKDFVVFDQYKRIAEAIAQQYGERVYGKKLVSVEAAPRMEKKKAKKLLEAGRVIDPEKTPDVAVVQSKNKPIVKTGSVRSLTNPHGVYTKETAGDRYEQLRVPIPATSKYEVTIALVEDEHHSYRYGLSIQKNFGDHSSTSTPVSNSSKKYKTRKEALQAAFGETVSRIQSQLLQRDTIISDQDAKNRMLTKALIATVNFARELGILLELESKEKEVDRKKDTLASTPNPKTKEKTSHKALDNNTPIVPTTTTTTTTTEDTPRKDKKTGEFQETAGSEESNLSLKIHNPFGIDISNMMKPDQIAIEFFAGGIQTIHVPKILERYPALSKINNKSLSKASPYELFQLAQLPISKTRIQKDVFQKEWSKRGESVFRALGFPMDLPYPYISILNGYVNVSTLGTILKNKQVYPAWLVLAMEYRPIANPEVGIQEIDFWIRKHKAILKEAHSNWKQSTYTNRTVLEKELAATKEILQDLKTSKKVLQEYVASKSDPPATETSSASKIVERKEEAAKLEVTPSQKVQRIREEFQARGFALPYTGKQAFTKNIALSELEIRNGYAKIKLNEKIEEDVQPAIQLLEKELKAIEGATDKERKLQSIELTKRISSLQKEASDIETLILEEDNIFKDELFTELLERAKSYGYILREKDTEDFRSYMLAELFEGAITRTSPDMPIGKAARILMDGYFPKENNQPGQTNDTGVDHVIAIMHDHYMEARRLSRKKVEAIKELANVPNLGMLWEAVELSWLLWYKMLNSEPIAFDYRLRVLTRFWKEVQPTYYYSDSSKELYKQYSTPCPIAAIIAEYTCMSNATRVFEPSAGNGLLVMGADPQKTHVNEIDTTRRTSLEKQGFATITHFNAAEPLPDNLTKSFDVMVTNPPFASWDADAFDRKRIVRKYFNSHRRLDTNRLRLEHVMSGLALHTLKDSGKAALIIMGHIYFDDKGLIAKSRPFLNWLFMQYRVDDIINIDGHYLYNKQGATPKTMLILISGRRPKPSKKTIAPTRKQVASLDVVVNTFEGLWQRVKSHIKTPLELLIQKLKFELTDDIL